jgi:hypothetical protein
MKLALDLILYLAVVVAAWWREPTLGILLSGVFVAFVGQHWRSLLLIGHRPQPVEGKRKLKSAIMAILMGLLLAPFFEHEIKYDVAGAAEVDFQEELLPLWVGMVFLSAMGLLFLLNERRKR